MPGILEGSVTSISDEGNLITDITADQLEGVPRDESVVIRCDDHETQGIFDPDHGEPASTFLAVLDPSGQLELTIVGVPANQMLGIAVGQRVEVRW